MRWCCEKLFNDPISMTRKTKSDVCQSSNTAECDDAARNCSMTSYRWRQKGHQMLVNDQTLANMMMLREIVQWSNIDEEKKNIGCWSIIKYCRMRWCCEKLFNDLISMKRKRTSDIGQSSNIGECDDAERNCLMIWSWWRRKRHQMLVNHQALTNVFIVREFVQWSHLDEEKRDIRCSSIMKHWRMCSW